MDKLRDTYEAAGQAAIDKVKLTDQATFEVSLSVVPNGEGLPVPGWLACLTLKHNLLLGQPPIVGCQPVPSTNLSLDFVGFMATQMLESARQERDKLNAKPGPAQGLPAGLVKR